ncbi:MAG: TrkA family potassium uptake protein [Chloroflexi bacterium]|nr:TrkA family potassium uptake protein [Chloroflexota bacterium]
MYIVIVGGGKVGYYLAKHLLHDGHEVLVIEKDRKKEEALIAELGEISLRGDGTETWAMNKAGLSRADIVIAVTGDDEDNLMISQMAKSKYGVRRAIARINNPKNEHIFRLLGIQQTVSTTEIILAQIEREIPAHSLVHLMTLREAGAAILEARVPEDSPAAGKMLKELNLPDDFVMPLIIREGKGIVPQSSTLLNAGDEVVAVTTLQHEKLLEEILNNSKK